jgi:hypothetical protein
MSASAADVLVHVGEEFWGQIPGAEQGDCSGSSGSSEGDFAASSSGGGTTTRAASAGCHNEKAVDGEAAAGLERPSSGVRPGRCCDADTPLKQRRRGSAELWLTDESHDCELVAAFPFPLPPLTEEFMGSTSYRRCPVALPPLSVATLVIRS